VRPWRCPAVSSGGASVALPGGELWPCARAGLWRCAAAGSKRRAAAGYGVVRWPCPPGGAKVRAMHAVSLPVARLGCDGGVSAIADSVGRQGARSVRQGLARRVRGWSVTSIKTPHPRLPEPVCAILPRQRTKSSTADRTRGGLGTCSPADAPRAAMRTSSAHPRHRPPLLKAKKLRPRPRTAERRREVAPAMSNNGAANSIVGRPSTAPRSPRLTRRVLSVT
jgi:hypothetical protein